jgi:cation diffusion facilitator CzcD-associated flavoprotein CzcO
MRVCVVGAGGNGLCCANAMLSKGFNVQIFERTTHVGGLWQFDPDPKGNSSCYQSLVTNTPKRLTAFKSKILSLQESIRN